MHSCVLRAAASSANGSPPAATDDPIRLLLDLPPELLDLIATAAVPPACVALSSACKRLRNLCASQLSTLRAALQETRYWLQGRQWRFRAHIKHRGQCHNDLKTWRGVWDLDLSEGCMAVLSRRAAPGATKETRWFGKIINWVHLDVELAEIEWGLVAEGVGVERHRSMGPRHLGAIPLATAQASCQPPEESTVLTFEDDKHQYALFGRAQLGPRGIVRLDAVASGAIKGCTFVRPAAGMGKFTSEACGFDDGGPPVCLINWLELVDGFT